MLTSGRNATVPQQILNQLVCGCVYGFLEILFKGAFSELSASQVVIEDDVVVVGVFRHCLNKLSMKVNSTKV